MPVDDDIWKLYAKGVKKIKKTNPPSSSPRKRGPSVTRLRDHDTPALPTQHNWIPASAGMTHEAKPVQTKLERSKERDLRQGEIALEARIDLHGMTQAVAFQALAHFMAGAVKTGKRNLLIITGKGTGKTGVLRTNLPHWLQTLPEASQILTLRPAAPKHGGAGAFYVLLKKPKK